MRVGENHNEAAETQWSNLFTGLLNRFISAENCAGCINVLCAFAKLKPYSPAFNTRAPYPRRACRAGRAGFFVMMPAMKTPSGASNASSNARVHGTGK